MINETDIRKLYLRLIQHRELWSCSADWIKSFHLRFFDHSSGKMVHQMLAHSEPVVSIATDPSGLYLLSGSHDSSVRLWSLESRTCIQDVSAHRKKHDESIYSVAFHPTKEFFASAGADALAKIFV